MRMFEQFKKRVSGKQKPKKPENGEPNQNQKQSETLLPSSLEAQVQMIETLFQDVDVLITRQFQNTQHDLARFCLFYCDGLADSKSINDFIIRPLMEAQELRPGEFQIDDVMNRFVEVNEAEITQDLSKIVHAINYGDTVLFADGFANAIILNSKGFSLRGITEPESEKVLSGPREGFTEGIMLNLSLIRRRLSTNELKMKMQTIGRRSKTQVCVCYLDSVVNKEILDEVLRRLQLVDMDGVIDSNYIAERISNISTLGFNTCGVTERPDIIAGKLLEGRIAILVDGSPAVLTVPYLFVENFQSNEDYYVNYYYATFSRILRIIGFILTITIPALYVAVVTHHHELLPTQLLISVASERESVPLPAAMEAFVLLVIFDILRETGIRVPSGVGQALSIVGALVIGQSAVEAGLVAAPMIIVVAFTGITNLLVPKLSAPALVIRYGLLFTGSCFGLLGVTVGCMVVVTHVVNLDSFGINQLVPIDQVTNGNMKDIFIRSSWKKMLTRLSPLSHNRVRAKEADSNG